MPKNPMKKPKPKTKSKPKKQPSLPIKELIRLALVYAEQDRLSFSHAVRLSDPDEYEQALDLVKQFNAYRLRRYGKTPLETSLEDADPKTLEEVRKLTG
jgi:hypothetical protein